MRNQSTHSKTQSPGFALVDKLRHWLSIGHVVGKMMVVVWTEPEENLIRIISARKATGKEVLNYFRFLGEQ